MVRLAKVRFSPRSVKSRAKASPLGDYRDGQLHATSDATLFASTGEQHEAGSDDGRPLGLLDLPDDILSVILDTRSMVPPTTLVELACVCKAAASVALPLLYTHLFVPSLASLQHIFATLTAHPDLAEHVQSVTVSEIFVTPEQFKLVVNSIGCCMLTPTSRIISMTQAPRFCDPAILNGLPMPWFTRLARACPNLRSIDMSKMATENLKTFDVCLNFGFLDLARILAQRLGRFTTSFNMPVSAILVKDPKLHFPKTASKVSPTPKVQTDLFFVDGTIDWGRQQLDVTNFSLDDNVYKAFALIPFSDLVSSTEHQVQAQWTIRRARLEATFTSGASRGWKAGGWLASSSELWARVGWRLGQDSVFDLSMPGTLAGPIEYHAYGAEQVKSVMRHRHVNTATQVRCLDVVGARLSSLPSHLVLEEMRFLTRRLRTLFADPAHFTALRSLKILSAFYFTVDSAPSLFGLLARNLPSLVDLELEGITSAPDAILVALDCLLRRRRTLSSGGCPLDTLSLEFRIDRLFPFPTSSALGSCYLGKPYADLLALSNPARTPLHMARPTGGHLRSLTLKLDGPAYDDVPAYEIPSFAMHPGLLHGIDQLTLHSFKLFVMPRMYAHPQGPSFLPIEHIVHASDATQSNRTLVDLSRLTLPRLRTLVLSSRSILADVFSRIRIANDFARLPGQLPACPNLSVLDLLADDPPHSAYDAAVVARVLIKYPRLVHARMGPTRLSTSDLRWLVDKVLVGTTVWRARPKARNVAMYNVEASDPEDCGLITSSLHVSDLVRAPGHPVVGDDAPWAMTSVEAQWVADNKQVGSDPMAKTCTACGRYVKYIRDPMGSFVRERNVAYAKDLDMVRGTDVVLTADPVRSCPSCAVERDYSRFGNKMGGGVKASAKQGVGELFYFWKEGRKYPLLVD